MVSNLTKKSSLGSKHSKLLRFDFCEKLIIVSDANYITSAIRKFMLKMSGPGSFQNKAFEYELRACETMWSKLGKYYRSSIENQLAQPDSSLNADQRFLKEL